MAQCSLALGTSTPLARVCNPFLLMSTCSLLIGKTAYPNFKDSVNNAYDFAATTVQLYGNTPQDPNLLDLGEVLFGKAASTAISKSIFTQDKPIFMFKFC